MPGEDQHDKTEPATPRRRQQFRDKGQVAKSKEIISVLIFLTVLLVFYAGGNLFYENISTIFIWNFKNAGTFDLNDKSFSGFFLTNLIQYFKVMAPLILAIPVVIILGYVMQTRGIIIAWNQVAPDPSRVDPFKRFKQMFLSMKIVSETTVNVLKVVIIGAAVIWIIMDQVRLLPELIYHTPMYTSQAIILGILKILAVAALFFIIVAVIDFSYQWYSLEKQMRMSRQEMKDEHKESEGDPMLRGRMKSRMRDLSANRLIKDVPMADVIITNPTHIAIALRYRTNEDESPRVLAKGKGFWAERIKAIGRENKVEIVEDKLLARALYGSVKVGHTIPVNLYKAVAEILAHVFKLRKRAGLRSAFSQAR